MIGKTIRTHCCYFLSKPKSFQPDIFAHPSLSCGLCTSSTSNLPSAVSHQENPALNSRAVSSEVQPFSAIPGPPRLPLVGSLLSYKLGLKKTDYYHENLQHLYRKYGPIVREDLGPTTIIHIFDPVDVNHFYKTNKTPYIPPLVETTKEYKQTKGVTQGIGNTNGPEWELLRKAVNKFTLKPEFVQRFVPIHDAVAIEAVNILQDCLLHKDGSVPLLEDLIDRLVTESSHRIVLGRGQGSLDKHHQKPDDFAVKIGRASRRILDLSSELKLSTGLYRKFTTPKVKELNQLNDFFYGSLDDICSVAAFTKGAAAVANLREDDSIMFHMMRDNLVNGKEYFSIISSILTDSYTTTVPSLQAVLHLLALFPEVQEELREEADRVCPPHSEPLTHYHLAAAEKLTAFLKESFRIYPIGESVQRLVKEDTVIKNYHLPAGTRLDLNVYIWLRDPNIFPEPDRVILDRWSRPPKGGVTDAFHPILNIPFSTGVRSCVGRRLATYDISCFVLRLLQRFRLSQSRHKAPRQVFRILLRPEAPLPLTFQRRT